MRISDWSSDVCSSDLGGDVGICRVRGSICQRAIIIIDLPVQGLARELEATEITLPMRIDVGTKGVIVAHRSQQFGAALKPAKQAGIADQVGDPRSEEHTSELQSLMRISYAVFCLKKKKK